MDKKKKDEWMDRMAEIDEMMAKWEADILQVFPDIKALYAEAQEIVDRNGWGEGVRDGMSWPVPVENIPVVYCEALLTLIFIENGEVNPTVEIHNQKITPDMVNWYARAEECEELIRSIRP